MAGPSLLGALLQQQRLRSEATPPHRLHLSIQMQDCQAARDRDGIFHRSLLLFGRQFSPNLWANLIRHLARAATRQLLR